MMDLEFKVLHSTTPMFANAKKIEEVMAEEAKAGWQLLEKLDNYKLRLQRDISHRSQDKDLGFDAYRSQVGVPNIITYGIAAIATLAVVYLIFAMVGAV
jgi:hypothetical protein